jgi:hypothetical protein
METCKTQISKLFVHSAVDVRDEFEEVGLKVFKVFLDFGWAKIRHLCFFSDSTTSLSVFSKMRDI